MGLLDNFINEKNFNKFFNWVEWQHVGTGLSHCGVCLVLNKCWFNNALKPKLPQHEKCHCFTKEISQPIPNKDAKAKCDIRKFSDYIFADKYAWNGKRNLFEMLGFGIQDVNLLKSEYEKQAVEKYCLGEYVLAKLDEQGQRINIDINITNKNGRKIVFTSGWMVEPKGEIRNNTPLAD